MAPTQFTTPSSPQPTLSEKVPSIPPMILNNVYTTTVESTIPPPSSHTASEDSIHAFTNDTTKTISTIKPVPEKESNPPNLTALEDTNFKTTLPTPSTLQAASEAVCCMEIDSVSTQVDASENESSPPSLSDLKGPSISGTSTSIDDIETAFKDQFPPDKRVDSRDELIEHVKAVSKKWGFEASVAGERYIRCSRFGSSQSRPKSQEVEGVKKRKRKNIIKCGCKFVVAFNYVIASWYDENKTKLRSEKDRVTPDQKQVEISASSDFRHSGGCMPSYQQYIMQAKRAGTLLAKESEKIDHLLSVMERSSKNLDNSILRAELALIDPTHSHITSCQLRNFRLWEKRKY